jgi:hypothetical protein
MKACQSTIEPLESRIAPAAVFTYTSIDGGKATITSSKGTNAQLASAVTLSLGQVTELNLSNASFGADFAGANITVTEKIAPTTGDGLVNIGWINAAGINLGSVTVKGDLGEITAADGAKTIAIKSLTVQSFGQLGASTGAPSIESDITGNVGALVVKSDFRGVFFNVDGNIGSVNIGNSIIGGSVMDAGHLGAGTIGSLKIGGSIFGGSAQFTGAIGANKIPTINIGGSIIGGSGSLSGEVGANIGTIHIGGSVIGGSGSDSGEVEAGTLAAADIGGSLVGGSGLRAGEVFALNIEQLKIGGDIQSGKVVTESTLVSLTVNGSAIGSSSSDPVIIAAEGVPGKLAIGSIHIHGDVNLTNILAGYSTHNSNSAVFTPDNRNAPIGSVKVGGDWIASNLVAGAENTTSSNADFGNGNDALIPGGNPALLDSIGSITIGGQVQGTLPAVSNTDSFGFVAQEIGSMSVAGTVIPIQAGPDNDNRMIGVTGDVTIHEV